MSQTVTCAVTGSTGYVGAAIVRELRHAGIVAIELCRPRADRQQSEFIRPFTLGQDVPPDTFRGVDVLIHGAYDFTAYGWPAIERANVQATLRLFESAKAAGVKRLIFISSMSAFEGCRSWYGRAKLAVEHETSRLGLIVVRPGLVFSDALGPGGGMVGSLEKLAKRLPVLPLVGRGGQRQYMVHDEDLGRLMAKLCVMEAPPIARPIIAAKETPMTFRQILERLAARHGRKARFIPVPPALVFWPLRMAEAVGLRMRVRSDGLIGLLHTDPSPDFSAAREVGVEFKGLEV